LSGANDGLNTVVPITDERYREIRPNIGMGINNVFSIEKGIALHNALTPLADAWEAGDLSIIQGLGYPGQNRSHFKSIALWETGGDGLKAGKTGWLTEDIENMIGAENLDAHGVSLDGGMGVFASSSGLWLSMTSLNQFSSLNETTERLASTANYGKAANPALAMVLDRGQALNTAMSRISKKIVRMSPNSQLRFNAGDLGRQAAMAAQLIDAGIDAPVLKIKIDGFDTHENQTWRHRELLQDLGRGLAGLRHALMNSGHWENTLIMTYSEFGRRAVENESGGTDHGTAAPHFMMGGAVSGGIWGIHPDLGALDEGDMAYTMDYRSVYDLVLAKWFGLPENRFKGFSNSIMNGILTS
jgi:uncharacterized protein (DUF1501 family)